MKKMNLENLNGTSKFVSSFPLELLRVGEKYFFYNVVQVLVNVPHLLNFSIMLLSF